METEHEPKQQNKTHAFLTFSAWRVILFGAAFTVVLAAYFLGPALWCGFGAGQSNAFHYSDGALAVHYLDVGQGDAIVVQLPDGRVVMIDCGTVFYYTRVKTYLTTRILTGNGAAGRKIDFLIATHSHDDHVGGFPQLLADFDVDTVYRPHNRCADEPDANAAGPAADAEPYARFIAAAYAHAREIKFILAGETIDSFNYVMYFHTPTPEFISGLSAKVSQDFNDISPIISLRHENRCFIFTGDAGEKAENRFRSDAYALWIDENFGFENLDVYLKVGHHASKTSSTMDFLDFVKPNKAIICVGARNNFGHPNADTVRRLEIAIGGRPEDIMETSRLGNIVFLAEGGNERTVFAFDNEPDMSLVYVLASAVLLVVCFVNFRVAR